MSRESLTSLYSEAGVDYNKFEITGDIQFSLTYNSITSKLVVNVIQCRDLVPVHKKKKTSDP